MRKTMKLMMVCMLLLICINSVFAKKMEKIKVAYMLTMNTADDKEKVQDAVNELLQKKGLDVQVEFICIDFASWSTQMNLMLADGSVDLFNACWMPNLSVLADNGSVAPLDKLLDKYGQGILTTIGNYIECTRINGVIYGVPKLDAFSSKLIYVMRKDIADKSGIDPEKITDMDSLTEALKVVKKKNPGMTMIANSNGGTYLTPIDVDYLGTQDPIGCLMLDESNDLKVVNYYKTDAYKKLIEYGKKWANLGFFMKDPINAQDGAARYIANDAAFGTFMPYCSKEVAVSAQSRTIGTAIYASPLMPNAWSTSGNVTGMTWCITSLSKHQKAAMEFLNELYIESDLENLVCNGIKNVHYIVTDKGNITFPNGLNAMTTGWPSGMGTFWPNLCITYPWSPDPANIYDLWLKTNKTCKKSPALGFSFYASGVADEIAACSSVVDKYASVLQLNIGDVDSLYKKFIQELDTAGIDKIISEKQKQLNVWAARKK
jgi:putative aldouronate transport system substrate-binding protein